MPRMAIAVIIALGVHVVLLMTILPEEQVKKPEIKGAGRVTVSIVRHLPPVTEIVEKPVQKPKENQQIDDRKVQIPQVVEEALPVQKIPSELPKPVVERSEISIKRPSVPLQEKKRVKPVKKKEPVATLETGSAAKMEPADEPHAASEMETLRSPKPVEHLNRPPDYPVLAQKRGWQGTVLLEVEVQDDGMVKSIQVKKSSSYELLDREALKTVRNWHFSPGINAGEPVAMKVLVPIHFLLQDK